MGTKYFLLYECENSINIRYKGMHKNELIFNVVFSLIIALPMCILSIILFANKAFFYAIMFLIAAFIFTLAVPLAIIDDKKQKESLQYIINESGITHKDINSSYQIEWADINSWGFIDNNVISGIRKTKHSPKQICLYFSKNVKDEQFLRKKFDNMGNKSSENSNSNDIIALGFKENEMDKSIFDFITAFVNKKIENNKNHNYLKEINKQ